MPKELCPHCNQPLTVADWPFCPHGSTRSEAAQRWKPIVVFKSADGRYRFPGRADAKVPKGYEKVELTNRRQVERFEREINQRERAEYQSVQQEQLAREAPQRELMAEANAQLQRLSRTFTPAGKEAVAYLLEKQRAEQSAPRPSFDPGFHVEIMHNNQSNRDGHNDDRTGWRTIRE